MLSLSFTTTFSCVQFVEGHFDHLAHNNAAGFGISEKYYVNEQTDPEYPKPNELSRIMFSVQDRNGHDVHNIIVMVEVYSSNGQRISVFPWTKLDIGDFSDPFIFPKPGEYQIVISILNDGVNTNQILNTVPPPRPLLNDNTGCNCERGVLNASVTNNTFGTIFVITLYLAIFGAVFVLGTVLFWMYWSRRKEALFSDYSKYDFIKYSVLFFALGASVVHLAVYPEHGALRLEYSIFLLSASGFQLAYGIMYILLIFSEDNPVDNRLKRSDKLLVTKQYYKKSLILNLFGLVGSLFLIFLYLYSVSFPPPLSPNSHPEDIDISGIMDKSLEVILVIGILFLMRYERKRYSYTFGTSRLKKF
ncbi:MAG: hypothetical protein ABJB76_04070 [Candidatus Nitrosocosmicus sp.]